MQSTCSVDIIKVDLSRSDPNPACSVDRSLERWQAIVKLTKHIIKVILLLMILCMNNHIYSTLFKIQETKSDRRSKEIEQRKESQNTHTQNKDM